MNTYKKYFKELGLSEDLLGGGVGDKTDVSEIDPQELEMGTKEEMEHTKNQDLAREIAIDHLTEDPHYYSRLKSCGLGGDSEGGEGEKSGEPTPCGGIALQKLLSPTAINPMPVIGVAVRGSSTGVLPSGGIIGDSNRARFGGFEPVHNLKANSQGAISSTPKNPSIEADGGHYTPDNPELAAGAAPKTSVEGSNNIHPMQVQQLGNSPIEDDGTSRGGDENEKVEIDIEEEENIKEFGELSENKVHKLRKLVALAEAKQKNSPVLDKARKWMNRIEK